MKDGSCPDESGTLAEQAPVTAAIEGDTGLLAESVDVAAEFVDVDLGLW